MWRLGTSTHQEVFREKKGKEKQVNHYIWIDMNKLAHPSNVKNVYFGESNVFENFKEVNDYGQ